MSGWPLESNGRPYSGLARGGAAGASHSRTVYILGLKLNMLEALVLAEAGAGKPWQAVGAQTARDGGTNTPTPHHAGRRIKEEPLVGAGGEEGEIGPRDSYVSPWDASEYWYGANPYENKIANQYSYNYEFDGSYDTQGECDTTSRACVLHSRLMTRPIAS